MLEELGRRISSLEERLRAVAGDRSLCDLGRTGAGGGAKELEGRLAALREVRRSARQSGADDGVAVLAVLEQWRAALPRDERRGAAWAAYRRGGVDELSRLVEG